MTTWRLTFRPVYVVKNGRGVDIIRASEAMGTKIQTYTYRLLNIDIWWKRILDVQRPYRMHLKSLKLGFVLDVGCGIGRNLTNLGGARAGIGVDHNPHSVEVAKSRGLVVLTSEEFHTSPEAVRSGFDSLLLSHVAEHMTASEVVALLKEYLVYLRPGGRVVAITPQEAGYRSDPTHVEFVDLEKMAAIMNSARLRLLRQYSFPLPRLFGSVFRHNEFITIGQKATQTEASIRSID